MPARLRAVPEAVQDACVYGRVSDVAGREEIISPEVQEGAGRDRCATQGWRVAEVIVELDATGRNFARAGVRAAIEGVEQGRWRYVVVYRYDRFGRNARDSLVNIARVEAAGGEVVSVTEPFDAKTAIGKYGRTNILAVAELQSDLIGESWAAAHARRINHGLPHSGTRRLGYTYERKTYHPDPTWAPVVDELYRRYSAGEGLRSLAGWLNSLGAPTRTKAGRWSASGVKSYLSTGFAAGLLQWGGEQLRGAHEPIISERRWRDYQAASRRKAATPQRLQKATTPLSGVILCAGCRRPLHYHHSRSDAYDCQRPDCPARGFVLRARVEERVLAWLADYDAEISTRARAKDLSTELRVGARAERRQLEREITRLDKALVQLTKDRAVGLVPDGAYIAARDEFELDKATANKRLAELVEDVEVRPPAKATVHGLLADWTVLPVTTRQRILASVLHVKVVRVPRQPHRIVVWGRWEDEPD